MWKRRRITIWGLGSLFVLIASPIFAVRHVRLTEARVMPSLAVFAISALIGWLILGLVFRFESRPRLAGLLMVLWALGMLVAARLVSGVALYGGGFGGMLAWLPHCWPLIGTRPSN